MVGVVDIVVATIAVMTTIISYRCLSCINSFLKLFYPLFLQLDALNRDSENFEKSRESLAIVSRYENNVETSTLLHNLLSTISGILRSQIDFQVSFFGNSHPNMT